jgi:hypothetical protein
MKPVDYRNETFQDLQDRISRIRSEVYHAWQIHGPCTTQQLADRSGISILTLRPRTTELYQIDAVILVRGEGGQGIYRAASTDEMHRAYLRKRQGATDPQLELAI